MTGAEVLALYESVSLLLGQQAALFGAEDLDLGQAENLSTEITRLLASVPAAEQMREVDDAMRGRLIAAARRTAVALAESSASLERLRRKQMAAQARAERDGATLRRYLPPPGIEPARYLDERR